MHEMLGETALVSPVPAACPRRIGSPRGPLVLYDVLQIIGLTDVLGIGRSSSPGHTLGYPRTDRRTKHNRSYDDIQ